MGIKSQSLNSSNLVIDDVLTNHHLNNFQPDSNLITYYCWGNHAQVLVQIIPFKFMLKTDSFQRMSFIRSFDEDTFVISLSMFDTQNNSPVSLSYLIDNESNLWGDLIRHHVFDLNFNRVHTYSEQLPYPYFYYDNETIHFLDTSWLNSSNGFIYDSLINFELTYKSARIYYDFPYLIQVIKGFDNNGKIKILTFLVDLQKREIDVFIENEMVKNVFLWNKKLIRTMLNGDIYSVLSLPHYQDE